MPDNKIGGTLIWIGVGMEWVLIRILSGVVIGNDVI